MHALRSITSKLPERHHREVKTRYWAVLDEATSASDAKAGLLALAGDYRRAYPSAIKTIDEHADQLVAHLRFPLEHGKRTRSTNLLEGPLSKSAGAPRSSDASPARPRRCP